MRTTVPAQHPAESTASATTSTTASARLSVRLLTVWSAVCQRRQDLVDWCSETPCRLYCAVATLFVAVICLSIFVLAPIGKAVSYRFWYQEMVRETVKQTITEMAATGELTELLKTTQPPQQ